MCEQTEVNYLDGDVVWVKLGSCWWPGEVRDLSKIPPEIVKDFKKQPIAVVKFFQEDQYEYVKNLNHIYKYNCRRKNEFVKKGLDMHRAKNAFMDKFPTDVCHAETLTGGDPDIITNDEFAPEPKPSYSAIFGTPTPKKSTKPGFRGRPSLGSTPKTTRPSISPQKQITHPRFVGKSDHEVRILEQSTPVAQTSHYSCHICGFESTRLNVIVLHNRSHSNGTYVSPSKHKTKKNSPKKGKRAKSFATTNSIDEDLELIRQGVIITTEENSESENELSEKPKSSNKRKSNKTSNNSNKKAKVSSICNNLLADWGDSDEETTTLTNEVTEVDKSVRNELASDLDDKIIDNESVKKLSTDLVEKKTDDKTSEQSSCFDFKDEEENSVLEQSPGRKIPRVIPPKRISKDTSDITEDIAEKETESMEVDDNETKNDTEENKNETNEPDLNAFKNLLEETTVPNFSTLAELDKKSDDSSIDKTNGVIKIKESETKTADNETEKDEPETSVAIVPKKRIVRNFEEFENLLNEQKQVEDEEEDEQNNSTLEVSKLKSQLMNKLNEPPTSKNLVEKVQNSIIESEVKKTEEDNSQTCKLSKKEVNIPENNDQQIENNDAKIDNKDTENENIKAEIEYKDEKSEEIISKQLNKVQEEKTYELQMTDDEGLENEEQETIQRETNLDSVLEKEIESTEKEIESTEKEVESTEKEIESTEKEIESTEKEIESTEKEIESTEKEIESTEKEVELPKDIELKVMPDSVVEEVETLEKTVVDEEFTEEKDTEISVIEESIKDKEIVCTKKMDVEEFPAEQMANEIENFKEDTIPEEICDKEVPSKSENIQQSEDSRSKKMLVDISDICIDNSDNLSGLSTLAAVSELTGNLLDKQETAAQQSPIAETKEDSSTNDEVTNVSSVNDEVESRDMSPVQDEVPEISNQQKPVQTLANFSMDFSDSNSESTIIKTIGSEDNIKEKAENIETAVNTDSEEPKTEICETTEKTSVTTGFESIESEIEKITSMETNSDKLNSFPENISQIPEDCISIETTEMTYSDFQLADTGTAIPGTESADFASKINETVVTTETTLESEIAKLTDTQPGAENVVQEQQQNTSSSKLLEILTDSKRSEQIPPVSSSQGSRVIISSGGNQKVQMVISGDSKTISKKFDPKTSKFVIKSASSKGPAKSNKPIILSEKIIKPMIEIENISVKKVTSNRTYQDVEDIDTFIIQKTKKPGDHELKDIILTPKSESMKLKTGISRGRGKPKIIEHTIIKAADVVQPSASINESQNLLDDSMFDINSMPIVLSDQILTPESIENIPVMMSDLMSTSPACTTTVQTVISAEKPQKQTIAVKRGGAIQQVKLLNKGKVTSQVESSSKLSQNVVVKNIMPRGLGKNQKVYQTGSKILKNNPAVITQPGKPGKFIILPSSTSTSSGVSKYTVGKRLPTIKSSSAVTSPATSKQLKTVQSMPGEPTGNKIMIVTNQQGVQSRVLLTPAQQKMLGCKVPSTKITKSPSQHVKGGVMQKSILTSKGTIIGSVNSSGLKSPPMTSQTIVTSKGQMFTTQSGQTIVTSEGQVLTPITQQQLKSNINKTGKKIQIQSSRVLLPDKSAENSPKGKMNILGTKSKTVLIKGAQGQALKKIQTPANDPKNILLTQAGHKSQLVSIAGSLPGKQVMVTSRGHLIKPDGKVNIPKQTIEKVQRLQSPKSTPPRIVSKTSRTQVLLSPVSGSAAGKQQLAGNVAVPPLAPITAQAKKDIPQTTSKFTDQKLMSVLSDNKEKATDIPISTGEKPTTSESKQPNQLIIQDPMGNQTTVTEGQILALPSGETVDGQPQSYVLVTVDESGNLVPISNDTLMSLDPNLALGGDMNNIVLQIDQGAQENQSQESKSSTELPLDDQQQFTVANQTIDSSEQQLLVDNQQLMLPDQNILPTVTATETQQHQVIQDQESFVTNTEETQAITSESANLIQEGQQAVACSINNGDSSQQLIITGDPESTQKFLASLSEGNTDLSSLLSGTDGNIIINTDGQQILLNTDSENQILLSVNSDNLGLIQTNTESDATQNAMYVTQQAIKNQDILAAALADTDVFQQESADKASSQALTKISSSAQSQLSPNSALYPMNVSNVLETSLTLGSPIMTPLEVPSVSNKKINSDVESTLITQVPSSLELPITITDPNISQTVSQQVMLGTDPHTNMDLPISLSENTITSIRSREMNSPNFVYSLPTLDENTDLEQKRIITSDNIYSTSLTGSMSMPLLTEEPEMPHVEQEQISSQEEIPVVSTVVETSTTETVDSESVNFSCINTENLQTTITDKIPGELQIPIEEELDLNSSDICSSLSEPPPGMFDKSSFSNFLNSKGDEESAETEITTGTSQTCDLNEQINSLPILPDHNEPEHGGESSDILETSTVVTEKNAEGSNLDTDYGVSESSDQQSISETIATQEIPRSELSETPTSELNSPRLDIDENSVELPIQPPIITNLSDTFTDNPPDEFNSHDESRKRVNEDDEIENDVKRTKLSCD